MKELLNWNWRIGELENGESSGLFMSKYYQAAKNVRQAIIEFSSEESQGVKSNNLGRFLNASTED